MQHSRHLVACRHLPSAHEQRGLQYTWSVILSICYHVFCHYAQRGGQKAIPTLDYKNGNLPTSTAFKSFAVKTKRTSQYANKHGLPRPDSARFEHGGGSRSNTKGEYVVLVQCFSLVGEWC